MPIKDSASSKKSSLPSMSRFSSVRFNKTIFGRLLIVLVVAGSLASAGYFYYLYSKSGTSDVDKTVRSVRKLMMLPDEIPTMATVTDKTKLQSQPFFQLAQNGDKVLIYKSIEKAILYRPSENRIVDVAPVRVDKNTDAKNTDGKDATKDTNVTPTVTQKVEKTAKVAFLNGTTTVGATKSAQDALEGKVEFIEMLEPKNAQSNEHRNSVVVVLNDDTKEKATEIAKLLGFELVEELPLDEDAPKADIVVIVGAPEAEPTQKDEE